MAIADTHAHYSPTLWKRQRDAVAGQRAIHAGGEAYLPKLASQDAKTYAAYRDRTGYYNATGRTVQGMVGLMFRKAPSHDFPPAMQAFIDDVTLGGVTAASFAKAIATEVLTVGRAMSLVEFPAPVEGEAPLTAAQASDLNLRPFLCTYYAENLTNWSEGRVNNVAQATQIRLLESWTEPVDEFSSKEHPQRRVLDLHEGAYRQRIFRQAVAAKKDGAPEGDKASAANGWPQVGPDMVPLVNGKPLASIPMVCFGPEENSLTVQQPPLEDIAHVNIAHYRTTADYENACHFVGCPTPWVTGHSPAEGEAAIAIGSPVMMVFPDQLTKVGILELEGKGLSELRDNLTAKEAQMAALGARMLAPEKAGVEAAATLSLRHNGEQSALASIADLISEGMTRLLRLAAAWMGIEAKDCVYKLNTDYLPAGMTAQEMQGLVSAWQQGAISRQTLFSNLQRGEIIASDVSYEDEEALIADEGPTLAMQTALISAKSKASETKKSSGSKDDEQ